MRKCFRRAAGLCAPFVVERELDHVWDFDAFAPRHFVPVVGMEVRDLEEPKQLVKAHLVEPKGVGLEEPVKMVELNDHDAELFEQAIGYVQQDLVLAPLDIHLQDHLSFIGGKILFLPRSERGEDIVVHCPQIFPVEGALRPSRARSSPP